MKPHCTLLSLESMLDQGSKITEESSGAREMAQWGGHFTLHVANPGSVPGIPNVLLNTSRSNS